jgi:hypothetical protein
MGRQIGGRGSIHEGHSSAPSLRRNPYSVAFDALGWVDVDSAAMANGGAINIGRGRRN